MPPPIPQRTAAPVRLHIPAAMLIHMSESAPITAPAVISLDLHCRRSRTTIDIHPAIPAATNWTVTRTESPCTPSALDIGLPNIGHEMTPIAATALANPVVTAGYELCPDACNADRTGPYS